MKELIVENCSYSLYLVLTHCTYNTHQSANVGQVNTVTGCMNETFWLVILSHRWTRWSSISCSLFNSPPHHGADETGHE